jgi:hypothetical protein
MSFRTPVTHSTTTNQVTRSCASLTSDGDTVVRAPTVPPRACYITGRDQGVAPPSVQVIDLQDGTSINVTKAESEAFWTWAVVETLRHTGVRVEELVEITHLAVISYRPPGTARSPRVHRRYTTTVAGTPSMSTRPTRKPSARAQS